MGVIPGYLLCSVGKKGDVRQDGEEGGIYQVDSDMDVEELNEMESESKEAMVQYSITIEY